MSIPSLPNATELLKNPRKTEVFLSQAQIDQIVQAVTSQVVQAVVSQISHNCVISKEDVDRIALKTAELINASSGQGD